MQTFILNHYPPVIRNIREIQQIAAAEDIEFSKLGADTKRTLDNMFVLTADITGVQRFEKMLGIRPKATQGLKERKSVILFTMNRRKMGLSELETMLAGYSPGLKLIRAPDGPGLDVVMISPGDVRILNRILEEILPLDIYLRFVHRMGYDVSIRYNPAICFRAEFFPRYNLAYLRLDGSWKLDGTRRLNGYDSASSLDFYPVKIRTGTGASEDVQTTGQLCFASRAEPVRKTETSLRMQAETSAGPETGERLEVDSAVGTDVSSGSGLHLIQTARAVAATGSGVQLQPEAAEKMQAKQQLRIRSGAGISVETHSYMTKLNRLDGTWELDGGRKLDGGRYIL